MGITDVEEWKQREICSSRYRRREEMDKGKLSEVDIEREEECGICLEKASRIVLPNCCHSLCLKCYQNWLVPLSCGIYFMSWTFHEPRAVHTSV